MLEQMLQASGKEESLVMAGKRRTKETIGQRLARLRRERGVTQVELAELIGIGQSNVSDYERDVCRPNADMVLCIASALEISTDELLGHHRSEKRMPAISGRLLRRVREIQNLPRRDQQALFRTIDTFIRSASGG